MKLTDAPCATASTRMSASSPSWRLRLGGIERADCNRNIGRCVRTHDLAPPWPTITTYRVARLVGLRNSTGRSRRLNRQSPVSSRNNSPPTSISSVPLSTQTCWSLPASRGLSKATLAPAGNSISVISTASRCRRANVAAQVAAGGSAPGRLVLAARQRARWRFGGGEQRRQRNAQAVADLAQQMRGGARFPRSMRDSIARLHVAASAGRPA